VVQDDSAADALTPDGRFVLVGSSRGTLTRIGVISDTHGLLRPQAIAALRGVDRILHAGDVGAADVLEQLERLAPVTAVRGNNDRGPWAQRLAHTEVVEIGAASVFLLHDLAELDLDPAAAGFAVVVSGHSHKPSVSRRDGVLFVNPGSAGPRRFKLPIALALLHIRGAKVEAEEVELHE
jgi:putative phosphoesterase